MNRTTLTLLVVVGLAFACGGGSGDKDIVQNNDTGWDYAVPDYTDEDIFDLHFDNTHDLAPDVKEDVPDSKEPDAPDNKCTPSCDGRVCGDNGCGGSCGSCEAGLVCLVDGVCVPAPKVPEVGDLVITEIMIDPSFVKDSDGEWFEIKNTTAFSVSLENIIVTDGNGESFTINALVQIGPNKHFVLGRTIVKSVNGGVTVDWEYKGMDLVNSTDRITLKLGDVVIDDVAWDSAWDVKAGASMSLPPAKQNTVDNDAAGSWCPSTEVISALNTDKGTPGASNPDCQGNVCVPQCDGKQCGPNGCGGSCGNCVPGTSCSNGICVVKTGEPPVFGDIIINEVMIDPKNSSDYKGEWFEVRNLTAKDLQLEGMVARDLGGDNFTVNAPVSLPPYGYAVFGQLADPELNGGYAPDFVYDDFAMAQNGDELIIEFDGVEYDKVVYSSTGWTIPNGASIGVKATAAGPLDNDMSGDWCPQVSSMPMGDKGTPGLVNDLCN